MQELQRKISNVYLCREPEVSRVREKKIGKISRSVPYGG